MKSKIHIQLDKMEKLINLCSVYLLKMEINKLKKEFPLKIVK